MRVNNAARRRRVEASRQEIHIADDATFTIAESVKNHFSLSAVRKTIEVICRDTCFSEPLLEVFGVRAIDAKADGRTVRPALQPRCHDVADDLRLIDGVRQLLLVVFACDRADCRKIGRGRRINDEAQEEPGVDQFARRRRDYEVVIEAA